VIVVAGAAEEHPRARPWREALRELRGGRTAGTLSGRDLVAVLAAVYPGERNAIYRAVQEADECA
jgi:hypothetical protein